MRINGVLNENREMKNVSTVSNIDLKTFEDIRSACQPVMMRGFVADWPIVAAARQGDEILLRRLPMPEKRP